MLLPQLHVGEGKPPNNYGEKKVLIGESLHMCELVLKIWCICSDFRNENFKNFVEFYPDPPRFHSAKLDPTKAFCPATTLDAMHYQTFEVKVKEGI